MEKKKSKIELEIDTHYDKLKGLSLSELHKMSIDIANDKMLRYPDTWKTKLGFPKYKAICKLIKDKRNESCK